MKRERRILDALACQLRLSDLLFGFRASAAEVKSACLSVVVKGLAERANEVEVAAGTGKSHCRTRVSVETKFNLKVATCSVLRPVLAPSATAQSGGEKAFLARSQMLDNIIAVSCEVYWRGSAMTPM
jgi:hypothetical protein